MSQPSPSQRRSGEPTSYDRTKYSSAVDWSRGCLVINGRPIVIVSAEFHYFRVPDRSRWRQLLVAIRGAGFNCIRLYFHWGYHSPKEGHYDFTGPRDVDYLLSLCTELGLWVITAPGPYICAETQAGGFPTWLIAKRHLRIRHLKHAPVGLIKYWDEEFHQHCVQYYRALVPILARHERTTNPDGCIILMQIENELRQMIPGSIGGLDDEIRRLAETARECGSTVPFFHNEDSPNGSWTSNKPRRKLRFGCLAVGPPAYRTDLYGTDLYFTFPPGDRSGDASSCQVGMIELCGIAACLQCCGIGGTGVGGSDLKVLSCLFNPDLKHAPPPANGWTRKQMKRAIDGLERRLERIGGSAQAGPSIVAEAQVGWINQWARLRTYDDVYSFFGECFSATLLASLAAQGLTCTNHYMTYGGTNYGCLGDTEVYTSYDYSAFIREYGKLSGRGRKLRQTSLFLRSFAEKGLGETVPVECGTARTSIKATTRDALVAVRRTEQRRTSESSTYFCFLRNFFDPIGRFNLTIDDVVVPCWLAFRDSLVAPAYYSLNKMYSVFVCTIPILTRARYANAELWVLKVRGSEKGRIIITAGGGGVASGNEKRKLCVRWASLATTDAHAFAGSQNVSEDDDGAATSYLSAPLEELPLSEWEDLPPESPAVSVRVSTENVGLCFTLRMSGSHLPCAVSVSSVGEGGSEEVILRLLAIVDADADTFAADLACCEPSPGSPQPNVLPRPAFSAAWGASELTLLPKSVLQTTGGPDRERLVFVVHEGFATGAQEYPRDCITTCKAVQDVLPGVFVYEIPEGPMYTLARKETDGDTVLDKEFSVPLDGWERHIVDWNEDAVWLPIRYEQRCPLNFHMTSGHVAYRVRFKTESRNVSIKMNIRHVAVLWCNGVAIGGQLCYSHNALSAGAMHAFDIKWAGKKRHSLRPGIALGPDENGFHNLIVLVQSLGQGRSPFLLNDVRNKRGLLSFRFSRLSKVSEVEWAVYGIPVSSVGDPFNTSGLPFEDQANERSASPKFSKMELPNLRVRANDGLTYYRTSFRAPVSCVVGSSVRYPLRVKIESGVGVVAMIWVNGLLIGRYIEQVGPQNNFYIPEGLIEPKDNLLVVAAFGHKDAQLEVSVLPWVVDAASGNIDEENGAVFAADVTTLNLVRSSTK